jgi:hypothetical protein
VAYAAITLVVLPALLFYTLSRSPHIVAVTWVALWAKTATLVSAIEGEEWLSAAASFVQSLLLAVEVAGFAVLAYLLAIRPLSRLWRTTSGLEHARVRWTARSALGLGAAGILMIVAALFPWRVLGPFLAGSQNGLSFGAGWSLLVCGVALMAIAVSLFVIRPLVLRRLVAVSAIAIALAGVLIAWNYEGDTRTELTRVIEASILRTTGRTATPQAVTEIRDVLDQFGISVGPGFGVFVGIAAGTIGMAGGVGGLATSIGWGPLFRRRRVLSSSHEVRGSTEAPEDGSDVSGPSGRP